MAFGEAAAAELTALGFDVVMTDSVKSTTVGTDLGGEAAVSAFVGVAATLAFADLDVVGVYVAVFLALGLEMGEAATVLATTGAREGEASWANVSRRLYFFILVIVAFNDFKSEATNSRSLNT